MPQLGVVLSLFMMCACGFAGRALYLLVVTYDSASPAQKERIVDKVCTALVPACLFSALSCIYIGVILMRDAAQ